MSKFKTYRHKLTGLVSTLHPITARAVADQVEEVREGAKPLVKLDSLQADAPTSPPARTRKRTSTTTNKEQKDV